MSTATKRNLNEALRVSNQFADLFAGCHDRMDIAGSIRRRKPEVGDAEYVTIPRFGDVTTQAGLFTETKSVNLLWQRMDELVADRTLTKHIYGGSGPRYGNLYRGVEFGGMLHEIFCADEKNWGSVLTIRTGPAEFSQRIVSVFKDGGMLRQQDGYLRYVASGEVIPVPDEQTYLKLAGMPWIEPENRS